MGNEDGPKLTPQTAEGVVASITTSEAERAKAAELEPICPYCRMDPLRLHIHDVRTPLQGGDVIITRAILCKNCRAPLPIQLLGKERSPYALPPGTQFKM